MFLLPVGEKHVVWPLRIDIEHVLAGCPDPLRGHGDEAEHEALDPGGGLHPEKEGHEGDGDDEAVEIGGNGGEQHEHGVLVHERLGQVRPTEVVGLHVEHLFRGTAVVVVQHDALVVLVPVVGQYAAVGVLPVEEVQLLAFPDALPLHHAAAVLHAVEALEGERLQLALLESYLGLGPTRLAGHLAVEALTALGADVELVCVLRHDLHDVLAVGAAVGAEAADADAQRLHQPEEAAQRLGLHEAHVGVPVGVLHIDDQSADGHHARTIAVEVLVGALRIVLLSLEEHVVEVHVVGLAGHELARGDEQPHQQLVEPRSRVEVVAVARLLCRVADVLRGKLADAAKHGVRARDAGVGTIHKVVLQVRVQVLHGTAAAEENTDDGTYDLALW